MPKLTQSARKPAKRADRETAFELKKSLTGIQGLDEITDGGLPMGRPTLVCGAAGSGKTLLAMSFLVNGARSFGEPGVLMTFEENADEIATDVASLGFDLQKLTDEGKLVIDYVHIDRNEIEETGEYDLEGLFVRLDYAITSIGAKRVVLDSIEALFAGLANDGILRAELRRLLRWLKDKGVTAVITGERGEGQVTRHGLEEYVSDAVILLDHRVVDNVSTRRLRVVKYRGSHHGTNDYPFLIDRDGIGMLPVSSLKLEHPALQERLSSGVDNLDEMLGGKGFFRGSTILVSGTAGAAKTTLASHFVQAACRRGERCLYFLSEESPRQIVRNMQSVGLDLGSHAERGLLQFHAERPTRFGLEQHLAETHRAVREFRPAVVVIDPLTGLLNAGGRDDVRVMLTRMIDYFKMEGITAMFTSLLGDQDRQQSEADVSSLMDTWLMLRLSEKEQELRRTLLILKSRGMPHSNRVREFALTDSGFDFNQAG